MKNIMLNLAILFALAFTPFKTNAQNPNQTFNPETYQWEPSSPMIITSIWEDDSYSCEMLESLKVLMDGNSRVSLSRIAPPKSVFEGVCDVECYFVEGIGFQISFNLGQVNNPILETVTLTPGCETITSKGINKPEGEPILNWALEQLQKARSKPTVVKLVIEGWTEQVITDPLALTNSDLAIEIIRKSMKKTQRLDSLSLGSANFSTYESHLYMERNVDSSEVLLTKYLVQAHVAEFYANCIWSRNEEDKRANRKGTVWITSNPTPDHWLADNFTFDFEINEENVIILVGHSIREAREGEHEALAEFFNMLNTAAEVPIAWYEGEKLKVDTDIAKNKLLEFAILVAADTSLALMYGAKIEHPTMSPTETATVVFWPNKPGIQVSSLPTKSLSGSSWQLQVRLNQGMLFLNSAGQVTVMNAAGDRHITAELEVRKMTIEAATMIPF